jgi:hypothetical protein
MKEHIPIFHNSLAGYLMWKGFVLQGIEKSKNSGDRNLNIYYFNDSEQLQNKINEYKELQMK